MEKRRRHQGSSVYDFHNPPKHVIGQIDPRSGDELVKVYRGVKARLFRVPLKIAEMVKDVILAGNLFTTLGNIDLIGNDFKWLNTGGGCGKAGQFPLPVGMGAPHIRIQNVVIGGQ